MCLSAILGVGSALIGASSASKAAKAQERAANEQVALQRDIYGQQKELFSPFVGAGTNALQALQYELGLGAQPEDYGGFTATPGYDFRLGEGTRAIEGSAAARGGLYSGAAMKDLQKYGQDYASSEYGNYVNRLAGLAGSGQSAAGMQGASAQYYGSGVSKALGNIGNALAAGAIGVGNALQGGMQNLAGYWGYQGAQNNQPNSPLSSGSWNFGPI